MQKLLVLLLILCMSPSAFSKDCLGYERELEAYLFEYKSGEMVNTSLIERLHRKCENPSAKFEMIYYYFLAVDAYHTDYFTDEEAYDRAKAFYEESALFFPEFDWTSKDRFIENFYIRAEGLEVVLSDLAYNLGYDERKRYIQASRGIASSPWKKSNIIRFSANVPLEDRSQRQPETPKGSFSKNYRDGDEYKPYPTFDPNPIFDEEGEPYGFVGNISEVNPIGYLTFLSGQDRNESPVLYTYSEEKEAALANNARYSRGNYRNQSRGADTDELLIEGDLIGINDRLELTKNPGGSSSAGDYLGFGEYAYRIAGERPVNNGGKTYLKVGVAGGRTGWVPSEAIVEKGELAVLLENTRGIPKINIRSNDRNAILFKAGELVILEDYREGMVKAVNRNGSKSAWIQDIGNISIEEEDIQIASLLHDALRNYTSRDLRSQLEAIKFIPGYPESPLSRIVEDNIRLLGNQ